MIYNSKLYNSRRSWTLGGYYGQFCQDPQGCYFQKTELEQSGDGGWNYMTNYRIEVIDRRQDGSLDPRVQCNPYGGPTTYVYKVKIHFPDGSVHELRPYGFTDGNYEDTLADYYSVSPNGWIEDCYQGGHWYLYSNTISYYSTDGTYLRLDYNRDNTWTLYMPDGSRVTGDGIGGPQRSYDRNGNYIDFLTIQNYNGTGHFANQAKDQFNRTITVESNGAGPNEDTITAQGFGDTLVWKVKWKSIRVNKDYWPCPESLNPCQTQPNGGPQPPDTFLQGWHVVDRITLPVQAGALCYTFSYNAPDDTGEPFAPSVGWGELSGITLPSGAQASYQYQMDGNPMAPALPATPDVMKNFPTSKQLVYRSEYDLSTAPPSAPCNPQNGETCITENWTYNTSDPSGVGTITSPDGGITTEYSAPTNWESWEAGLVYRTIHADGTKVERLWAQNHVAGYGPDNPYVKTEFTSIKNAAGSYVKTAIKDYNYDKNGNVTRVAEYDWVDYGSVPRDGNDYPTGVPTDAPKRVTTNSYYANSPDASQPPSGVNVYCYPGSPQLKNAVASSEVTDVYGTHYTRTELTYDNPLTTGNLTQQKNWDSTKGGYSNPLTTGNSVSVTTQYNQYGMPTLTTDAKGNQTQITYGSIGSFSDLYPTQITAAYGTSIQRTETREYYFNTGAVTRATDVDNNVAMFTDYDPFGRPKLVKAAEGKPEETRTVTVYSDVDRRVIVKSDMNTLGDSKLVSIQHYDQLGRVRLSRQLEDSTTQDPTNETHGIKVQTRYKFAGSNSYQVASHPYREAYSWQVTGTMDWTRSKADNGGRLIEVQKFGGASLPAPWGSNNSGAGQVVTTYDANFTTVTDQAGKVRRSMTNGLGQLVRVDEPDSNGNLGSNDNPLQPTSYTYDTIGNLITVNQDTQTRSFAYSSLGRLLSAMNPESGTISYQYDTNGNLIQKTDARGVASTYAYDALNRNTSVTYTNDPASTPAVTRTYDGATNGKGRLWKSQTNGNYGSLTTIDSYDPLGRPLVQRQQFYRAATQEWSGSFGVQRGYDLAGHVKTQTYPSGHSVSYNYDSAGRLADKDANHPAFSGNLGDGETRTYAAISGTTTYDAAGRLQQEQYGTLTPLYHKLHYNIRGQLYDVRLSTQSWQAAELDGDRGAIVNYYSSQNFTPGYTGTDNNGNITRQEINIPGSSFLQDNFTYDSLNRLTSISEKTNGTGNNTFKQSYMYDRWGNRRIDTANTFGTGVNNLSYGVDAANNRLTAPAGYQALQYDGAGNLTQDPTSQNPTATSQYDAENRLSRISFPGTNQPIEYVYDADGRRVRRISAAQYVWQVYGMDGELLAEYYAGQFVAGVEQAVPVTNILFQKEYGYRSGQLLITASSGDDNRIDRLITNFYFAALGRVPSATELSQQHAAFMQAAQQGQSQLLAAAQTFGQQLFDLEHLGSEYNQRNRSDEEFVTDLYFAYLQRTPEESGLGYWVWAIQQGVARAAVRDAFASSGDAEFAALVSTVYGIDSGDRVGHYLWSMYLGVPGNAGDFGTDLNSLNAAAAEGQARVIQAAQTIGTNLFQTWVEDKGENITDEQFAAGLFHAFLQREPSQSDMEEWIHTVRSIGREDAVQQFLALTATQELAGTLYREILWLTPDHLGTPRMISERSGSLAGIKRHDYLPFGEELFAGTGGRTPGQGYVGDEVRQQFTQKERDNETGLDYFGARYYASTQGRFTGVDPYNPITQSKNADQFNAYLVRPQNWNRYVYVLNNPHRYVDPDGERVFVVLYTYGNTRGGAEADDEFRRVAETVKKGIEARKDFDPKKDKVLFAGVSTKEEFKAALRAANDLEEGGFGKITNLVLASHGGPNSGPVFRRGGETEGEQQFADPSELSRGNMPINWEKGALATFLTCDSAQNFTRSFSEEQGVVSEGFPGGTTFSSDPGSKSHSYIWYEYGLSSNDKLYLIRQTPGAGGDVGPVTYVPEKNKEFVQKFVPKH